MCNACWRLTVLLIVAYGVNAQSSPPVIPTSSEPDPKLKEHLNAWEKAMEKVENFRVEISMKREDPVFKKDKKYTGFLLFMKPNFFICRLDDSADPTRQDYEAIIRNEKSIFIYHGLEKSITEYRLTKPSAETEKDNPELARLIKENSNNPAFARLAKFLVEFPSKIVMRVRSLAGSEPKAIRERFDISLVNEDDDFIYLDLKPRFEMDKLEYKKIRMALQGPKSDAPYFSSKAIIERNNGDTETWEFQKHQANLKGINKETFREVTVPGFTVRKSPITPELLKPLEPKPEKKIPEMPEPIKPKFIDP